jgi:hypothetical protein
MPNQLTAVRRVGKSPGENVSTQVRGHRFKRVHCRVHPFLIGTVFSGVQRRWRVALFAGQGRCSQVCSPRSCGHARLGQSHCG